MNQEDAVKGRKHREPEQVQEIGQVDTARLVVSDRRSDVAHALGKRERMCSFGLTVCLHQKERQKQGVKNAERSCHEKRKRWIMRRISLPRYI